MAWYSPPSNHRSLSPKRHVSRSSRSTWSQPRRSLVSWCLCVFVLIAIVFWPSPSKAPPTRRTGVQPRPRVRAEAGDLPNLAKVPKKRQQHLYRTDGLLDVNPNARHPILELIERSETQWKRKVQRQSKTFKQAIDEYRRRYKRSPPKGFEIWWDFVDFHDVKLIDEYDSIHERLQQFWGVAPSVLIATQAEWESKPQTFTIGKLPGASTVKLLNHTLPVESNLAFQRVKDQLELLEDIQEYLPDFRATFTMHDGPLHMTSWELRRQAEEAAERGEYIDVQRVAASAARKGWAAACPPTAPIHTYAPPMHSSSPPSPSPSSTKSFIYNHRLSMSPCLHPSHLTLNGYLSSYRYSHQFGPTAAPALIPTFSICVSPLHSDILTVAPEQYADDVGSDPLWTDKVDDRLLWRGSNTGMLHQEGKPWNQSQRIRLVEMGTRRGGEVRVLMPPVPGGSAGRVAARDGRDTEDVYGLDTAAVGYGDSVRTSALNAAFMDVAFVGKPIQCRDSVCKVLGRMFEWRAYQSWGDAWVYKYIMDIDGNGWSARFKRLMTSNSLIFKSTIFPEWYTERIMPWVHYIPVQVDLSDLYDILAFFRGDLSGSGAHDIFASRIADAGKTWSKEYYRKEDMTAYHFRLFLEYARVMSLDREAMSYKDGDEEHGADEL